MNDTSKEIFELAKLLIKHKDRIAILHDKEVLVLDNIIYSIYEDNIIIKAEDVSMSQVELNSVDKVDKVDIVFHFNKGCLTDSTIPMWVLKVKGKTHYVNHVDFENVSFSTKETPDNPSTKGSLKFKNVSLTIVETSPGIITAKIFTN